MHGLFHNPSHTGNLHDDGPDQDIQKCPGESQEAEQQCGFPVHAKDPIKENVGTFPDPDAAKRYRKQEYESHDR